MIRFFIKIFLVILLACPSSEAVEPGNLQLYVVIRTESVRRLPVSETGSLWPTNSCGIAEYSYRAVKLEEYAGYYNTVDSVEELPTVKAKGLLGEWCKLTSFLYEKPTLVTIESWDDIAILVKDTAIHRDGDKQEFIVDPKIIKENDWTDKLVEVPDPTHSSNCFVEDELNWSLEYLLSREMVQKLGDEYCYSKGVYIRELSKNWKDADVTETIE